VQQLRDAERGDEHVGEGWIVRDDRLGGAKRIAAACQRGGGIEQRGQQRDGTGCEIMHPGAEPVGRLVRSRREPQLDVDRRALRCGPAQRVPAVERPDQLRLELGEAERIGERGQADAGADQVAVQGQCRGRRLGAHRAEPLGEDEHLGAVGGDAAAAARH
jgi:hypothetical protein